MQAIALTGERACEKALEITMAFDTPPAGYVLMPLEVGGRIKGQLLHVLQAPSGEKDNDIPCTVNVGSKHVLVTEVIETVAVQALRRAVDLRTLILIGGVTAEMLAIPAFYYVVEMCLQSRSSTLICAEEDALPILQNMCGGESVQVYTTEDPEVSLQLQNALYYPG